MLCAVKTLILVHFSSYFPLMSHKINTKYNKIDRRKIITFKIKVNICFTKHRSSFLFDSDTTPYKICLESIKSECQRAVSCLRGALLGVGNILAKSEKSMYSCHVWCMHVPVISPGKCVSHG